MSSISGSTSSRCSVKFSWILRLGEQLADQLGNLALEFGARHLRGSGDVHALEDERLQATLRGIERRREAAGLRLLRRLLVRRERIRRWRRSGRRRRRRCFRRRIDRTAEQFVEQDRDEVALLEQRRLDGLLGQVGGHRLADETRELAARHRPAHRRIDPLTDGGGEDPARLLDLRLAVGRARHRRVDRGHRLRRIGRGARPAATRGEIGYRSIARRAHFLIQRLRKPRPVADDAGFLSSAPARSDEICRKVLTSLPLRPTALRGLPELAAAATVLGSNGIS